ncbi:pentatricopeptide repeat-containing protein At5g59600 [Typha latifolia]|uniref:pentatricopeptide repeat-containing protein At5g59600 n=1 Tax=Typha latifolia TaxID=4733 RepID=UPI003C2B989F
MSKRNLSRWITLIARSSRQGLYKDTLHFFHQMQREGFGPQRYVLPSVLRACANLSDLRTGKVLHSLIARCCLDSDPFISSALIDMYSKSGLLGVARLLFDKMADRDLVVWNSMISGYAHRGLAETAVVLFVKMRSFGLEADIVTWNALISGFFRQGNDQMAVHLFIMMRIEGIEPDVFTWTSIISGFVLNFHYEKALGMFQEMVVSAGILPSSVTIASLLPACANVADVRHGKEIHGYAVVLGVEDDLLVSSSLVDMYAKCGLISEAKKIFDNMRERSTASWNAMIFGLANSGYCDDALKLFDQMENDSMKPDHLTFTAIFTACSHAGMVETGKSLFQSMQEEHGIEPRLEHYACMVDLLGRAGKLVEAYDLIKDMPIEPDSFVWGALLGACRDHGHIELATIAASSLSKLEPESAASRVLLSNLLVGAGRRLDAVKMKKLIKKRRHKKFMGCTWMQIT